MQFFRGDKVLFSLILKAHPRSETISNNLNSFKNDEYAYFTLKALFCSEFLVM